MPRQLRHATPSGVTVRDVAYLPHEVLVELDGAFGHRDTVDRWADLGRDVHAAVHGLLTLRAGWAQVLEPCHLAISVGRLLRPRGWAGPGRACGPDCPFDPDSPDLGASSRTYRPNPPTTSPDSA